MMETTSYPGSPAQQALLRAISAYYADDPRVLAVTVFGSLGRGAWDTYSDCDLDVVIEDGVRLDVMAEVGQLCASLQKIGEQPLLILEDSDEAADVVLASLAEFSIRYHALATTSANIIDSLTLLTGRINLATIVAAGQAQPRAPLPAADLLLGRCIRTILNVHTELQRGRLWLAIGNLGRARDLLVQLFQQSHGGIRPYHAFQAQADVGLQQRLGQTLPSFDQHGVRAALAQLLTLVEHDLDWFTDGQIQLTEGHRTILQAVRRSYDVK